MLLAPLWSIRSTLYFTSPHTSKELWQDVLMFNEWEILIDQLEKNFLTQEQIASYMKGALKGSRKVGMSAIITSFYKGDQESKEILLSEKIIEGLRHYEKTKPVSNNIATISPLVLVSSLMSHRTKLTGIFVMFWENHFISNLMRQYLFQTYLCTH